jgi:hypothetical protein
MLRFFESLVSDVAELASLAVFLSLIAVVAHTLAHV